MRQNYRLELKTILNEEVAVGTSEIINLDNSMGFCVSYYKTDSSPTNKTFSSASMDAIEITNHGYKTGLKVRFTGGVLPTGLSAGVDYYLIKISDNLLAVADSQANASSGVYLDISGGSGTNTIHVQTANPCYLKLEGTLDSEVWFEICVNEIGNLPQRIEHEAAYFHKVKCTIINESGQRQIYSKIMTKGF